jgi:hypothetical protein
MPPSPANPYSKLIGDLNLSMAARTNDSKPLNVTLHDAL